MTSVLIYGAGSIGNHLAYACRNKNWQVTICDLDQAALDRTKNDIYPDRYGKWDESIKLILTKNLKASEEYELVIIGTPPDTHLDIAFEQLESNPPKVMLIEKPLCPPDLGNCNELYNRAKQKGTMVLVGYNHTLTEHTTKADHILAEQIGKPLYMYAAFREHWEGIFKAHPWLAGPSDSYLGFSSRGGGASGEHSHAINIWQHFSHVLGMGRISKVSAMIDVIKEETCEYDRIFQVNLCSEKGLMGHVVQDVITKPPQKKLSIQGEKGYFEWQVNCDPEHDALRYGKDSISEALFYKKRPDDFKGEIDHIESILNNETSESPISLERGLETMLVLAAAHLSNEKGKNIYIDYDEGYSLKALKQTPTL